MPCRPAATYLQDFIVRDPDAVIEVLLICPARNAHGIGICECIAEQAA